MSYHRGICHGLLTKDYYNSSKAEEIISANINVVSGVAWEYTFEHKKILSKNSKWYFSEFNNIKLTNSIGNKSDVELNIYYQKDDSITKFASIKSDVPGNRQTWPPSRTFKNVLTEDIVLEPSDKIIFKIESFTDTHVNLNPMVFYYAKENRAYIQTGIYENIIPPDFILMSPEVPSNRTIDSTYSASLRGVLQHKFDYLRDIINSKPAFLWNYSPTYNYLYFATSITQNEICKVFVLAQNITLSRDKISISDWNKKYTLLFYNPNGYTLKVTDSKNQSHTLVTSEKTDYTYVELFNFGTSTYNNGYIAMLFNNEIIILGDR